MRPFDVLAHAKEIAALMKARGLIAYPPAPEEPERSPEERWLSYWNRKRYRMCWTNRRRHEWKKPAKVLKRRPSKARSRKRK